MPASPLPVLYLNRLEHQGKSFIKFYFQKNPALGSRLKKFAGVKYSRQYRCFVTHFIPENLARLQEHFGEQVTINTRYLHRQSRLPAGKTVLTVENAEVLTALPKPA